MVTNIFANYFKDQLYGNQKFSDLHYVKKAFHDNE